jgi:hypothetical protein
LRGCAFYAREIHLYIQAREHGVKAKFGAAHQRAPVGYFPDRACQPRKDSSGDLSVIVMQAAELWWLKSDQAALE